MDYLSTYRAASPLYVAPYSAMFQSSGTGKSRTVKELACREIHVSYLCLRPEGSSGYPPRSRCASILLSCKNQDEVNTFLENLVKTSENNLGNFQIINEIQQNITQLQTKKSYGTILLFVLLYFCRSSSCSI